MFRFLIVISLICSSQVFAASTIDKIEKILNKAEAKHNSKSRFFTIPNVGAFLGLTASVGLYVRAQKLRNAPFNIRLADVDNKIEQALTKTQSELRSPQEYKAAAIARKHNQIFESLFGEHPEVLDSFDKRIYEKKFETAKKIRETHYLDLLNESEQNNFEYYLTSLMENDLAQEFGSSRFRVTNKVPEFLSRLPNVEKVEAEAISKFKTAIESEKQEFVAFLDKEIFPKLEKDGIIEVASHKRGKKLLKASAWTFLMTIPLVTLAFYKKYAESTSAEISEEEFYFLKNEVQKLKQQLQ